MDADRLKPGGAAVAGGVRRAGGHDEHLAAAGDDRDPVYGHDHLAVVDRSRPPKRCAVVLVARSIAAVSKIGPAAMKPFGSRLISKR